MSTKIHNGYRWEPPRVWHSPADPFRLVSRFNDVVTPAVNLAYTRRVVEQAVEQIDRSDTAAICARIGVVAFVQHHRPLETTAAARRGERSPDDFSCQIVILCDPADGDRLYFLTYTEADIDDAVLAIEWTREYRYWNNTDRPDDITEHQWEQRRETWDRVIGRVAPARRGLTWTCAPPILVRDRLLDFVPSRESRARAAVRAKRVHAGIRDVADVGTALSVIQKADEHIEDDVDYPAVLAALPDITIERLTEVQR